MPREGPFKPVAGLMLGLECGGSDGYSGISANPALGYAADLLIRNGGTAVLAETPEIYGAEHLLTRRAATPAVARKLLDRIEWWRDYAHRNRAALDNNPSHGNKAGGLTTILEKSLGAVAKSGSTRLEAVYEYAERVTASGFVFMDTPGYDPIAVTGQIAGGCNLVAFTTGRGSTTGYKPAPHAQDRHQHPHVRPHVRRHGHRLRRYRRGDRDDRGVGKPDLPRPDRRRLGRAHAERAPQLRRQ